MKFKGKVAVWFYLLIIVVNLAVGLALVESVRDSAQFAIIINAVFLVIIDILMVPMALNNYVLLDDETLTIHFGVLKLTISYKDISSIKKTRSPLSSLAASLDRLEIRGNNVSCMISVVDKKGFLEEMKKRNPDIKMG